MARPRIIPVLLLQKGGLVKTVKFKDPSYVGDPINAVKIFNELEVDELILIDIEASQHNREPDYSFLKDITSECFMPVGYAGGVKRLDQAQKLIQSGIEKIVINSAFLSGPQFLTSLVETFGSSTVVGALDVKKNLLGQNRVYNHLSRSVTAHRPVEYAKRLQDFGIGELFVNNVDQDGVMKGYDLKLVQTIVDAVDIPLIACGGCGSTEDLSRVIDKAGASAAAAGSFFVYQGPHKAVLISYPSRQQLDAISNS